MNGATIIKKNKNISAFSGISLLQKKAIFLDEILNFIEEKSFGYLMEETEKEKNISLNKARKQIK
ncbi:MAG: hypothetical protein PHE77_02930 [Candidatus Pacebacteria bacterium]|nr:hypothetical protein [Candidatus Paceibacterota bacterium]